MRRPSDPRRRWAGRKNGSTTWDGDFSCHAIVGRRLACAASRTANGRKSVHAALAWARRPVFPPSLRRAFHVKQNDCWSVLDGSALLRQRREKSEPQKVLTPAAGAGFGARLAGGRLPWHGSSVDTSNGAFHVKRASGEGPYREITTSDYPRNTRSVPPMG